MSENQTPDLEIDRSKGDFHVDTEYEYDAGMGLSEDTIDYMVDVKGEEPWLRSFRKKALRIFEKKELPTRWATEDLNNINFDEIRYYLSKGKKNSPYLG